MRLRHASYRPAFRFAGLALAMLIINQQSDADVGPLLPIYTINQSTIQLQSYGALSAPGHNLLDNNLLNTGDNDNGHYHFAGAHDMAIDII